MVIFNALPIFKLFGGYMYIATDVCTIFSRIKNTVSMFFFHNYILLKSQGLKAGAGEPALICTYRGSPFFMSPSRHLEYTQGSGSRCWLMLVFENCCNTASLRACKLGLNCQRMLFSTLSRMILQAAIESSMGKLPKFPKLKRTM